MAAELSLISILNSISDFNSIKLKTFSLLIEFKKLEWNWLNQLNAAMISWNYYNSKYIDAEETDVSRNQTSTWLMNSAEVVSKEEIYSSGIKVWLAAFRFSCGKSRNENVLAQWIISDFSNRNWILNEPLIQT